MNIDEQWELNPVRDKNEGTYRGEEGTIPVTTAWPEEDR